jgi:3-oxoacyl-[acyl-carrier protein] reductase
MRVLVTGASRGIGRATAVRLARRERADAAVNYRQDRDGAAETVAAVEEAGGEAVPLRADVSDPDEAAGLVADAADALGGLDAVVNNAGVVRPSALAEVDDADWRAVLGTNLSGPFYVARAAAPRLTDRGGGLVNVSSVGGVAGTVDVAYAASKAGLHGLTRALARELGPEGVTVNAVAPGPVETEMNGTIVDSLEERGFHGHEDVGTHLPTYACDPDAVAHSVEYLLTNPYVHGEVLNVNGGMAFR